MKKLVLLSVFISVVATGCTGSGHIIRERDHSVNNDTVDYSRIIATRFFNYDKDWKFVSGYKLVNGLKDSLSAEISECYRLPLISSEANKAERDPTNRIVRYETYSGNERILHICKYDEWGNLTLDRSVYAEDTTQIVDSITYEYTYLTNFKYKTKGNGKLEIKSVDTSPWVLRTARKNGHIVESTERNYIK